jgi:zinc protease
MRFLTATPLPLVLALVLCNRQALRADEALPPHEAEVTGRFDNGLSYVIRRNANPPGRVTLNLHIKTGALNETGVQNGLAHFLEHMAFNGSRHFKPGELVPLLERLGMRFGADTNAHTNLWETVYKLNLPDNKPETIDLAMKIFSDYADALLLSDEEIESERKVILEEARSGKSAAERVQKQFMRTVFVGTRLAVHDVIGDEELIKTFPQAQFQDYWNTWYRPENMTLVVVGDVEAEPVVANAKQWLGAFKARADSRQAQPAGLKTMTAAKGFVFTDPEQVGAGVQMMVTEPARQPVQTYEDYRRQIIEDIATSIVDRRFGDMVSRGGAPFRGADTDIGDFLNEAIVASGEASGEPEDWNKILDGLITEISRAVDHGFTKDELELVKKGMLAAGEQSVRTEATRDSGNVAGEISGAIGLHLPRLSAKQRLALTKRILDDVTLEELHQAFGDAFKTRNYSYVLTLPSPKDGTALPSSEDVIAAANAAWSKKTEPPTERKAASDLLAAEPDAGKVVSQEMDETLKLTTLKFANNVVMHHKFNDYKKDQASVRVTLPGGQIEETAENRGVTEVAALMLSQAATSRHSSNEIRDMFAGRNVRFGGGVALDSVILSVSGNPKDLGFGMSLAYAVLTDGRLEQSAVDNWTKAQRQAIVAMEVQPGGQLQKIMARTFLGGDPRLQPFTSTIIDRLSHKAAEEWFRRIAAEAPIEVTVVGDISLEDATALVARYIGSLPKRTKTFDALDVLRKLERQPGPFSETVRFSSVTPQAVAMAGFVSCNDLDPDRRPLLLAASILTDRMIAQLREKEQLVYSISASNQPGRGLPGMGVFTAASTTDPKNAEQLADRILDMMRELAANGPTEEELATAKRQTLTALSSSMREPNWWMGQIAELSYRSRSLDDIKALPGVFDTFTTADVRDVVRKYMKDDAIVRYVVIPEAATPATKASTQPAEATTAPAAH